MIYVTGDCHGDFSRFYDRQYTELTEDDTIIVCGDFGIWKDTPDDKQRLDKLSSRLKCSIVFVDGNHENHDRLDTEFEVIDFHGGKAHEIRCNIHHLMRGYVFEFEGKKFFCFGGAKSHDIWGGILDPTGKTNEQFLEEYDEAIKSGVCFRVKGVSWWERELPSQQEMQCGIKELDKVDWCVDYVITHCLPTDIQAIFSNYEFKKDVLTDYLMDISHKLKFKQWYCGHYHSEHRLMGQYQIIYYRVREII